MFYSHYYTHGNDNHTNAEESAKPYQTKVYNFPPVKVFEEPRGFTFFMPCLPLRHRKGLTVLLGNGKLKFSGLRCSPRSGGESEATVEEDGEEKFHKSFHIAVPVRENAVEIIYEDEFLLVWVPKEGGMEAAFAGESVRDTSVREYDVKNVV